MTKPKRRIGKIFTVKGQRKRASVTIYNDLDTAVRELGELRVLKDINDMSTQRARWAVASRMKSGTA